MREAQELAERLGRQAAGHRPGFERAGPWPAWRLYGDDRFNRHGWQAHVALLRGGARSQRAEAERGRRAAQPHHLQAAEPHARVADEGSLRCDLLPQRDHLFRQGNATALFERMATMQRPGDFLFLGHSESLYRVSDRYELIGRTIYRRTCRTEGVYGQEDQSPRDRRFGAGAPDPGGDPEIRARHRGRGHRERSVRGARAHQGNESGCADAGRGDAAHGRPHVPVQPHAAAPDAGGHGVLAHRARRRNHVQGTGARRRGLRVQAQGGRGRHAGRFQR